LAATPDPETGRTIRAHERVRRLLDQIELADKVGLDVYGLAEHHRRECVVSAPAVVLAPAATRTKRIVSRARSASSAPTIRLDRFLIQLSVGTLPHEKVLHAIELFGTKVAPIVRREVERRSAPIPMPAGGPA